MPWLSVMELNPKVTGERAKCNRRRAYDKYKERFFKLTNEG